MNWLQRLWRDRFESPRGPLWAWCLRVWPLVTLPSLLLAAGTYGLALALGLSWEAIAPPDRDPLSIADWLGTVLFAPAVETLLLLAVLAGLRGLGASKALAAVVCGLLAGAGHASFGATWFAGPASAFFVYAWAAMAWWPKGGRMAFWAAALPHALNNMTALVLVAAAG